MARVTGRRKSRSGRIRHKKSRTTRRAQRGGSLKDITIGILSWKSPLTLKSTLDSYRNNGLLDLVKSVIYFQERSHETDRIAREYGINKIIGTYENLGVLHAFLEIMKNVHTPYFIMAEADFKLIHNKEKTKKILTDCMKLIRENGVKYVRLRDRRDPGVPLHSRKLIPVGDDELDGYDFSDYISKPEMVHFFENPEEKVKDVFTVVGPPDFNYKWYLCDYEHYHWSTNIYIAETKFIKEVIIPILLKHREVDMNGKNIDKINGIEPILWDNKYKLHGYKVASGEGLFKHIRLDDCVQHCDNVNSYNALKA